jgi:steroid delta-isomerase-like uncharacterized protein
MANPADIHRIAFDAWNRRDFEALRSLYHSEYSYTGGDGKELTGGPDVGIQIARMYASAFPDATLEIKRVYTQGDTAVAEILARGTHKGELMGIAPTGRPVEIIICNVAELRDGKIYREREYMDMLTMMTQLGVVSLTQKAGA